MATLKEDALTFVPKTTKNIADLSEVPTDLQIFEGSGLDNEGKVFTYKFVELNGEEYRVPDVVRKDLKSILVVKPNLKKFKVLKSGEGIKTRYTLLPLD